MPSTPLIARIIARPPTAGPALLDLLDALPPHDITLLHSSDHSGPSVLACNPLLTIEISPTAHPRFIAHRDLPAPPFTATPDPLTTFQNMLDSITLLDADSGPLPLIGWLGGISYDIGRHIEHIPPHHPPSPDDWPLLRWTLFDSYFLFNPTTPATPWTCATLDFTPSLPPRPQSPQTRLDHMTSFLQSVTPPSPAPASPPPAFHLTDSLLPAAYHEKISRIQSYIAAGDIYQANFAQRWTLTHSPHAGAMSATDTRGTTGARGATGLRSSQPRASATPATNNLSAKPSPSPNHPSIQHSPFRIPHSSLYRRLCAASPAPYAAFLTFDNHAVLCASPELFLLRQGDELLTRPIKGTRPRHPDPQQDAALRAALLQSPKDHAELAMIVDLLRNDLGRICSFGSIHVTHPRTLEPHPTVWHTVASIRGRLTPSPTSPSSANWSTILRALCPGGSITGAPKIRAMQIIEQLEPARRGWYCGHLGWIGPNHTGALNIAIRTLFLHDNTAHLWAGGGITADSDPTSEHAESLTKARALFQALNITLPSPLS